jgi:hypothetical protein
MSRNLRASICLLLALLNALVVFTGTAGAEVLCFGSDGHITIENPDARAKCCGEKAPMGGPGTAELSDGPLCVDVPIFADTVTSQARASIDLKPAMSVIPLALANMALTPVDSAALIAAASRAAPPPKPPLSLASLRTIILLI